MLVAMLVTQLYGYEALPKVLSEFMASNDRSMVQVSAGMLILAELMTLPYLLGMYISRLLRYVSAGLAFGVSCFWLFVVFTNAHIQNSGLFSDTFVVPGGIAPALWAGMLFFVVAWVIAADSNFKHAST